jgi:CubicO group peptidase (beta-lactamase class C family)
MTENIRQTRRQCIAGLAALAISGVTGLRAAPRNLSKQLLPEDRMRLQRLRERLAGANNGVGAKGQSIADRLRLYHVPGAGIAVISAGQLIAEHAYGLRRAGSHSPVTRFQAASISKPVTALATLQLVERGVLNLDEDVNRYLRSWTLPASSYTQNDPVTLRRIMSHTAGLTVHGFEGYPRGAALPTLVQILDGAPPANSPPVRSHTSTQTILVAGLPAPARGSPLARYDSTPDPACTISVSPGAPPRLRQSCQTPSVAKGRTYNTNMV